MKTAKTLVIKQHYSKRDHANALDVFNSEAFKDLDIEWLVSKRAGTRAKVVAPITMTIEDADDFYELTVTVDVRGYRGQVGDQS